MIYEKVKLYEDRDSVTLTSYIIDDSQELLKGGKRGAVLVCPGGAYLSCSDREGEAVALRFAAMGYHAFVLRYSVYGASGFAPGQPLTPKPEIIFPQPMRDIAKAFLYIGERAETWHIDMEKIAICGFSAGAHNCSMYSVYWDKPIITEHFGVAAAQLKPCATILAYTLSDYMFMKDIKKDPMMKWLFDACNTAFLGTAEPDDEMLSAVSSAKLVDENTPPMFLWATAGDHLVPVQHTLRLANALADKGIPFEVHVFEEGEHGLSLADQSTAANTSHLMPDAAQWVMLAEKWLAKRMALDIQAPQPFPFG